MANVNVMEGPLSKWTNVVKGWQYRWFVLDEARGILSYYTSKEKMQRGSIRGCVRLKGARIGIDDEDDSTFTITVDEKTFHFQARDGDERENWISALESAIMCHAKILKKSAVKQPCGAVTFETQLTETDAYLQILIDQVQSLETRIENCDNLDDKERYHTMKSTAKEMIEAIKHCIMMLQISKESLKGSALNGVQLPEPYLLSGDQATPSQPTQSEEKNWCQHASTEPCGSGVTTEDDVKCPVNAVPQQKSATDKSSSTTLTSSYMTSASLDSVSTLDNSATRTDSASVPDVSYSSSEDESFYDVNEFIPVSDTSLSQFVSALEIQPEVISAEDDYFDELYDIKDSEQLDSLNEHGSLISYLISQVRIGMDLTKVVLPTFILERRSLLEMYADFLAHPDIFCSIADKKTPEERMIATVRWYLSAFHAGRNGDVAKKPYNPILGETFSCCWKIPGANASSELVHDGPVPWASRDSLAFVAEQVSHHPPTFYAENYNKRISCNGYIWTKSKFLGLSIGVHLVGQSVISVLDYDEEYTLSFPNGYGRSILTVPWFELGGKIVINCAKSGYTSNVSFHTKPFYGGKKHRVTAEIFSPNDKRTPICSIEGTWNGEFHAKYSNGATETFIDTIRMPVIKKIVKPREQQLETESRRLWEKVTAALKERKDTDATEYKHILEEKQREEARERKERNVNWQTKHFHEVGEHWVYDRSLLKRLGPTATTSH